jgi:hypothetical protein
VQKADELERQFGQTLTARRPRNLAVGGSHVLSASILAPGLGIRGISNLEITALVYLRRNDDKTKKHLTIGAIIKKCGNRKQLGV